MIVQIPSRSPRVSRHAGCAALVLACALAFGPAPSALAADTEFTLTLDEHVFTPDTIEVPAGERIRLTIVNNDRQPEEFDSADLHVEKIVAGQSSAEIAVGPLKPGTYGFMGEFHADTALGKLVAR